MAKFILSISDESFEQLAEEAKDRGVKVQLLIRAVIIPEWVRLNLSSKAHVHDALDLKNRIENIQPNALATKTLHAQPQTQKYEPVFVRSPRR